MTELNQLVVAKPRILFMKFLEQVTKNQIKFIEDSQPHVVQGHPPRCGLKRTRVYTLRGLFVFPLPRSPTDTTNTRTKTFPSFSAYPAHVPFYLTLLPECQTNYTV